MARRTPSCGEQGTAAGLVRLDPATGNGVFAAVAGACHMRGTSAVPRAPKPRGGTPSAPGGSRRADAGSKGSPGLNGTGDVGGLTAALLAPRQNCGPAATVPPRID